MTQDCVGAMTLPTSVRSVLMSIWLPVPAYGCAGILQPLGQRRAVVEAGIDGADAGTDLRL